MQREGYVDRACVKKGPDGEIEYVMSRPAIARGAEELVKEGAVPPHLSTSLMFAVLKNKVLRLNSLDIRSSYLMAQSLRSGRYLKPLHPIRAIPDFRLQGLQGL
ncbi:MAG: hypothetical protein QXK66_00995 [Sulfolobales archaeon]